MLAIVRALALILVLAELPALPAAAQVGKTVDTPAVAGKNATYLTSAPLRERALAALFRQIGSHPLVSKLEISPDRITLWTQSENAAHYTDSWTAERMKLLVFDHDTISGPEPTDGDGIVARREGSFFDLNDVALDRFDALIAQAIEIAGMEALPTVTSLTIARQIGILPDPHYGDVQWTIGLATDRETATIYADIGGTITGADLSGTTRAQRLDLIAADDWPMQQAEADIARALGSTKLNELRLYNSYIYFEAQHPTQPGTTRDYSWNLGGVRLGMDMPSFAVFGDTMPFDFAELDLERLPEIKRKALEAFASPGATITYIDAEKPTDRASAPQVLWSVDLRQADGETGEVLLDANAEVVEVSLPEGRLATTVGPWLAPETVAATLKRLEKEFGADAKFGEISLNDTQGNVLVEDPQAPGSMASFIVDAQHIIRFGTPMPWEAELDETRVFRISDLAPLDAATLGRFADETLKTMNLDGAEIERYTISRKALIMNPEDNRLLVEIRAGKDDGWTGGWLTFELDGTEADRMLP